MDREQRKQAREAGAGQREQTHLQEQPAGIAGYEGVSSWEEGIPCAGLRRRGGEEAG